MKFSTLAAIAALCSSQAALAQEKAVQLSSCVPPEYPKKALDRSGIVEAGFLVDPEGKVLDSFVSLSNAGPLLDRATLDALGKCRWTPRQSDGKPATRWQDVLYKWQLDPAEAPPIALLEEKAMEGEAPMQYMVALMYMTGYVVTKDKKAGMRWLKVSAERGFANAQYRLGKAFEEGDGVAQDDTQAALWYAKAAAQKFTFASDKVRYGFGSVPAASGQPN